VLVVCQDVMVLMDSQDRREAQDLTDVSVPRDAEEPVENPVLKVSQELLESQERMESLEPEAWMEEMECPDVREPMETLDFLDAPPSALLESLEMLELMDVLDSMESPVVLELTEREV